MQGLSKFLWHKLRACATMKGKNLSQTTIANDIEITENKAQYDANAKRLLANKVILAHIMHETMEEYKNCSVEEIKNLYIEGTPIVAGIGVNQDTSMPKIQGRNVESNSSNEGKITYDVRFDALLPGTEEPIYIIVNVEMQKDEPAKYSLLKRALYYCGRMLSAQYETVFTNSEYGKLRKVYSIWIAAYSEGKAENTISRYAVKEELLIGDYKENLGDYDMLNVILVRLGNPNKAKRLLRLLDVYFSLRMTVEERKNVLANEYNIPMETDKEDEDMGYFSERIYNQGVEDGIEKGKLTTLFDLVKKGTLTLAVAAAQFNMTEAQFIDAGKSIGLTL